MVSVGSTDTRRLVITFFIFIQSSLTGLISQESLYQYQFQYQYQFEEFLAHCSDVVV